MQAGPLSWDLNTKMEKYTLTPYTNAELFSPKAKWGISL